ncbi:hypothetical protein OH768_44245 [Streptomyces sp. NBC_01622]|uniref:DUF2742 domain-containing protein n=1 Tax=Streptomyces sp. NBC_01622 TaxID=2975903 RepID=UPI00386D34F2|nr:hypothetical protein OH768_44245 [Streptomyces sp. NBC_01622]
MTVTSRYDDPIALWASHRVTALLDGHDAPPPRYGTREWHLLAENDPRKAAALIEAAEWWRKYGDEVGLLAWFRDVSRSRGPVANRMTIAELDRLAKPKPTNPVQASQGWPPVAIPGRPGWYRHLVNGQQVDWPRAEMVA